MAQPLRLPIKIQLRCDGDFLAKIDAALLPAEDRSKMIRDAALAEAERRAETGKEKA